MPLYLKSSVQTLINYRHRQCLQTWSCRCSRSHAQLGARSFPAGESLDPSAAAPPWAKPLVSGSVSAQGGPKKWLKTPHCAGSQGGFYSCLSLAGEMAKFPGLEQFAPMSNPSPVWIFSLLMAAGVALLGDAVVPKIDRDELCSSPTSPD